MNLTETELQTPVGEPYLSRGETYFQEGLLDLISFTLRLTHDYPEIMEMIEEEQ